MRGSFRKELKRIRDSSEEDLYTHLWYFNNMTDQETPRESVSSIDTNSESQLTGSDLDLMSPTPSAHTEDDLETVAEERNGSPNTTTPTNNFVRKAFKRKLNVNKADMLLDKVAKQLDAENEDRFTVIGKNIANKLRDLSRETAIVAEKLINDILFEAEMGNLTRFSTARIQDKRSQERPTVSLSSDNPTEPTHYQQHTIQDLYSQFNSDFESTSLSQI